MKIPVGILGATGMVGQRFVTLLENHPWFVASQFHPEFQSKPDRVNPLFREFVRHAVLFQEGAPPAAPAADEGGNAPPQEENQEAAVAEEKI